MLDGTLLRARTSSDRFIGDTNPGVLYAVLVADIKGKLSLREQISEDFLTSSVFSAFYYVGGPWLERFLQKAYRWCGSAKKHLDTQIKSPRYEFWPKYPDPNEPERIVEPDVVVFSNAAIVVIEAKNYSGKSGEGVVSVGAEEEEGHVDRIRLLDQLAREYFVGQALASRAGLSDFYVVYLTRHPVLPGDDVDATLDAVAAISPTEREVAREHIYWINWQQAYPVFEEMATDASAPECQKAISRDVLLFLARRSLCPFRGFAFVDSVRDFGSQAEEFLSEPIYARTHRPYWRFIGESALADADADVLFYGERRNS